MNANNAAMYLAKIGRDGYSLGDNYGANGHNEAVKKDGWGHNYGFRPYAADGKYHTYRVVTEPNSDFSKVTITLYIDGDEHLKWEDSAPFRYNPEEWPDRILAGGFEFATTQSCTKLSLKSYELRDITGSDKSIYTESFNSTDNWTNIIQFFRLEERFIQPGMTRKHLRPKKVTSWNLNLRFYVNAVMNLGNIFSEKR